MAGTCYHLNWHYHYSFRGRGARVGFITNACIRMLAPVTTFL